MQDPVPKRSRIWGLEGCVGRSDLAGAAHLELVSRIVQLRPEDALFEAMLRGWRAQQTARGLSESTIAPRERLVRRSWRSATSTRGGGSPGMWMSGRCR